MVELRNYMNVSIIELLIIIILCVFIKDETQLVNTLLFTLGILAIVQSCILFIIFYNNRKNKNLHENKEKEADTDIKVIKDIKEQVDEKEEFDIRKELRKNITKELNKLNSDLSKGREDVISENLASTVKDTTENKEKIDEAEIVNNVSRAVENTYKDIYTHMRNKLSESNEDLIEKIEYKVKDYVGATNITDDISINIEINDMLEESMALYNREIKQLLLRQENSLIKEIDMSINNQLKDSKEILDNSNISFEELNFVIKKNTKEVVKEYTCKNEVQIKKLIEEINNNFEDMHESVNYEKVNEELKKNLESFKDNYINYIQKNVDSTLDIVRDLDKMEINNFKLIRKQEIKEMFIKAMEEATMEIDICTFSMNNSTMFKEKIYDKLKGALKRNTKVNIIYHKAESQDSLEGQKNTNSIAAMLKEDFKGYGRNFNIENKDIKETILICDNEFAIIGEFNFLGYEGKNKEINLKKEEMAAIITDKNLIEELRNKKFKK